MSSEAHGATETRPLVDDAPALGATLDRRLHAYRADLADSLLRGKVTAPRYVEGRAGWVTIGRAPVLREPRPDAETSTFCHYGEAVRVFDESNGFAWCQSQRDRYVGY